MSIKAPPSEQDYVFREVAAALARPNRVIPVLVGGARMPRESELPPGVAALARCKAIVLDDDRWDQDVARLAAVLAGMRPKRPLARPSAPRPLRARIRDAAAAATQAAQGLVARARAAFAFHTWPGAVAAGVVVGLVAALVLWRVLPDELVPVAADAGRSFVAFSADGRWLAVRSVSGQAVVVDATRPTAAPIALPPAGVRATAAVFAGDGSNVIVGYDDGSRRTFAIPGGSDVASTGPGTAGAVLALAARDESLIVLRPNQLLVTSPARSTGLAVQSETPIAGVVAGSFSTNAQSVALLTNDGSVQVAALTGTALRTLGRYPCGRRAVPTLSPDGGWLVCVEGDGVATLWNTADAAGGAATLVNLPGAADVTSVAFSPDSRMLAMVRNTRGVDFVDVASQRVVASTTLGGERAAKAAAFSPAGDTFVIAAAIDVELLPVARAAQAQPPSAIPPAERELVPSLLKMTARAAQSALDRHGLVVGSIQTKASAAPKDTIVAQQPKSGTSVAKGSAVNVTVSDGTLVRIPNVVGLPADAAEKTLFAARLTAVLSDPKAPPTATVASQDPAAGTEVAANASVRLTLAQAQSNAPVQQSGAQQSAGAWWCCVKQSVVSMSSAECERSGGQSATTLEAARAICGQSPPASAR